MSDDESPSAERDSAEVGSGWTSLGAGSADSLEPEGLVTTGVPDGPRISTYTSGLTRDWSSANVTVRPRSSARTTRPATCWVAAMSWLSTRPTRNDRSDARVMTSTATSPTATTATMVMTRRRRNVTDGAPAGCSRHPGPCG